MNRCVSMLGTAGLERERDYITDYYVKGMSKRAMGVNIKSARMKSVNRYRARKALFLVVWKHWQCNWIWIVYIKPILMSGAHWCGRKRHANL